MAVEIDFGMIGRGDWVWTVRQERWGREGERRIREVSRLTHTLIVCDEGTELDRFRRSDGWSKATYRSRAHIVGIATPEEIESIGIPLKNSRLAEKARRAKNDEMKAFVPRGMEAWLYPNGTWTVKFETKNLTEEQVRELAIDLVKFSPERKANDDPTAH